MAAKSKECNVPGCSERSFKAGVCKPHHDQEYFTGCSVDGCDRELFAKARCKVHYMRRYRKKKGEAAPKTDEPIRSYGQERYDVFTRIPQEAADVIIKAAGRSDGMYEKAQEILVQWAKRREARDAA